MRVPLRKADPGLSAREWLLFALVFLPVPAVNVVVSSVLYQVWKVDQPRRANQINRLGFLIFGLQVVVMVGLFVLVGTLNQ
jgi:hypothetical protein